MVIVIIVNCYSFYYSYALTWSLVPEVSDSHTIIRDTDSDNQYHSHCDTDTVLMSHSQTQSQCHSCSDRHTHTHTDLWWYSKS